jgi:putative ABC transport system permease protein
MFSATRAAARIGWRNIARHRGRSVLVSLLILLPVAAMVAGISILQTMAPTQEEMTIWRMGRADLMAQVVSEEELGPYLPAGSRLEPLLESEGRLVLPGSRPGVALRAMQLDGLAQGILTVIDGRVPAGSKEAAISLSVGKLAGVGIGGTITLDGLEPLTVVGLVENPRFLEERTVVVDPAAATVESEYPQWLIDLPDGADPEAIVAATYIEGQVPEEGPVQAISLASRTSGLIPVGGDGTSPTIMVFGALALLEASLIASAAFAVSIRRRQRELGLLAAAGATSRQLAGTVVAEAALIGILACAGGVIAGVLIALTISPFLDQLTGHREGPLVIDAVGLIGPALIGFAAALLAAYAPARSVARLPVLRALSGRRPAEQSARVTLVIGLVAIAASVLMTLVGASLRFDGSSLNVFLLMGGAVLGTLGFGACAPWLLERLELVAARLPLAGRIAFRDTARARSRSSPIVTAILAGLAASIAIGAWQASNAQSELKYWQPSLYDDQLVLFGSGTQAAGAELLRVDGVIGGGAAAILFPNETDRYYSFRLPGALHADGRPVNLYERCENCGGEFAPPEVGNVAAGTPDILSIAHAESAAEELREGRAVVLSAEPIIATTLEVVFHDNATEDQRVLMTLPVTVLQSPISGGILPDAFLPDDAIAELGLAPMGLESDQPFIVRYDHPVTDADLAQARAIASRFAETWAELGNVPPTRQGEGFRLLLIALVLLFSVSVTGIAIALGDAESRPEQRSLLALGADPGLRRRIAASRAAVLALVAGILAVPAGLLPVWGVFVSRKADLAIPTLEIAGALIALPLLAIASSWLLSRPIPDWSAFRNVRPGE